LLRQLLSYDAETGEFTWLMRPREMFRTEHHWRMWNTQHAGKSAGHIGSNGYLVISRGYFRAHRLAWLLMHGEPVPILIDHIDRNKLNNRISNLRAATNADNQANAKTASDNRSGVRGVCRHRYGFRAYICRHGRKHELGVFKTLEEAARARHDAASRLQGKFVRHE
jgi:hypothetical protein